MTAETLLKRVARLLAEGLRVHGVYEAGPTGFALARRLIASGATCLVVRPKLLDRYGRRRNEARPAKMVMPQAWPRKSRGWRAWTWLPPAHPGVIGSAEQICGCFDERAFPD